MSSRLTRRAPLATRGVDENEPRDPPPPATPLQFPCCSPRGQAKPLSQHADVLELFGNISRIGPQSKHVQAFGIVVTHTAPLDDLVLAEFLPDSSWLNNTAVPEDSDFTTTPPLPHVLSNGRQVPDQVAFYNLVKELMLENGDAFRSTRRQPMPLGRQPLQIIHSRKFWGGLADMSEYWDTSLDHYSDNADGKGKAAMDIDELRSKQLAEERAADEKAKNVMDIDDPSSSQPAKEEAPKEKRTYTGRRKETGSKMPNRFREETVSGFVEMILWNFGCTLQDPITQPKLHIHNVINYLPYLKSVHRVPKNPRKARAGGREGPMMGISCREQTEFRKLNECEGEGKMEIRDLLQESALMAMLAQKRAKEGQEQANSNAEKWWATKPRWGGGPGGEFGASEKKPVEGSTGSTAAAASADPAATVNPGAAPQPPKRRPRKASAQEEMWRAMKPPSSMWEKGITYQHIGKEKGSRYDNVRLHSLALFHSNNLTKSDISHFRRQPSRLPRTHARARNLHRLSHHRSL